MLPALTTFGRDSAQQFQQLQEAHLRALQALLPRAATHAVPAHPALLPLARAAHWQQILAEALSRQLRNQQHLWSLAFQPQAGTAAMRESLEMQQAAVSRLAAQQAQWMSGLQDILREAGEIRQANTLSKLMEQEYDVLARFGALLNEQATAMVSLFESLQIGYGYLLAQKWQE